MTFRLMVIAALATLPCSSQPRWPTTVHLRNQTCMSNSFNGVVFSGDIIIDDLKWPEMRVRGNVTIEGPHERTPYESSADFQDFLVASPKRISFGGKALKSDERITECSITFQGGFRISQSFSKVTADSTPIAKDEGCFRDFLIAMKSDGLERRKKLVELAQYNCIEFVPFGYAAKPIEPYGTKASGNVKILAMRPYFEDQRPGKMGYSGFTLLKYLINGQVLSLDEVRPE